MSATRRAAVIACVLTAALGAQSALAQQKTLKIGWTESADNESISYVAKHVLEKELGYKVQLVKLGVPELFSGVANGSIDLTLGAWLPNTHKSLYDPVVAKTVDLGAVYSGTKIGWIVPEYIPKDVLETVADLNKPEVRFKVGGKIIGIEPNTGTMRASRKAVTDYNLAEWQLMEGNESQLDKTVSDAVGKRAWFVATAWTPHYMFSQHPLRYLKDPKGVFGAAEEVHAIARSGFVQDHPKAAQFIQQFKVPMRELEGLMFIAKMQVYKGDTPEKTQERTAAAWISTQPKIAKLWTKGLK